MWAPSSKGRSAGASRSESLRAPHVGRAPRPVACGGVGGPGRSVPDMLASTANFLKGNGWQAGQSWEPGSANYAVLREWNRAEVYQRTIAVMAMKLRGGP